MISEAGWAVRRRSGIVRAPRAASGVLAGGLVAFTIVVCVAQGLASLSGRPGPGVIAVTGHVLAALAAVTLQLAAQRYQGSRGALAAWAVLALTAGVLWFGWWA